MLIASLKRRRFDTIATLALLALGIALLAALLTIYPLGGIRQVIYLGPIIFLAAGVSIHWMADSLAALTRREWLAPTLAVAAAGAIALAGVADMRQDSPYEKDHNTEAILAFLEENVEEGDMVYATMYAAPSMKFYQDEKPGNYYYAKVGCWSAFEECTREMLGLAVARANVPNRIFLVHWRGVIELMEGLTLLGDQVSVEHVIAPRYPNDLVVALIANVKEAVEAAYKPLVSAYEGVVSGEPVIRSDWDVYFSEDTLTYVKEPCAPADVEAWFFLALYPVDVNDLPDHSKQYGFENLDFYFYGRGVILDGRCMATVALPEYDIASIGTGQYVPVEGGTKHLWEGEFLNPALRNELIAKAKSDYEAVVSGEPVIRSDWDVYLIEDTLVYVKEPCAPADTEAWFFLALYPVDVNDLPDNSKQYGFDNLDFGFDRRGVIFDGICMVTASLPEYDIASIGTGQYVPVEGGYHNFWEGEFRLGE